ncbi:ATP-binding protein [Pseudoalteromonas sp.]|uniref:ATP-binding protein n=1 Tax=Pseudoalteromonas sp. TaxID=53249 RepID=UPI00356315E4
MIKTCLVKVTPLYPKLEFIYDSVRCDNPLIVRTLSNVLENAGRFANQAVQISCWYSQGTCKICIEDDGPGIPPGR